MLGKMAGSALRLIVPASKKGGPSPRILHTKGACPPSELPLAGLYSRPTYNEKKWRGRRDLNPRPPD